MEETDSKTIIKTIKESLKPFLVVCEKDTEKASLLEQFEISGFEAANDWKDALEILGSGRSCFANFRSNDAEAWFDIMAQYTARQGAMDILDPRALKAVKIEFDPQLAHLVLLQSPEEHRNWFSTYPALRSYLQVVTAPER